MSKGTALSRAIGYFREAHPDEARVAFVLVGEIMKSRQAQAPVAHTPIKPKQKRHRRTKAEMEAARAAEARAKAPKVTRAAVAASSGALSELYDEEAAS